MSPDLATYPGYRFPAEIISHAVWLYHVFSLSLRDVEPILAERGVVVTHESIRHWCHKFGAEFARRLFRRRPHPGDTWHLKRCSSASEACCIISISGVQWISTASCCTSWYRGTEMAPPPSGFSSACCSFARTFTTPDRSQKPAALEGYPVGGLPRSSRFGA